MSSSSSLVAQPFSMPLDFPLESVRLTISGNVAFFFSLRSATFLIPGYPYGYVMPGVDRD